LTGSSGGRAAPAHAAHTVPSVTAAGLSEPASTKQKDTCPLRVRHHTSGTIRQAPYVRHHAADGRHGIVTSRCAAAAARLYGGIGQGQEGRQATRLGACAKNDVK